MAEINQQNSGENPVNTGNKQETRDEKGRFIPGVSGNPQGRLLGTRNFSTIFDEAIKKIVKEKRIDIDDPEMEMVTKAVIEALKGDYSFYRDTMDRRYGKPVQPLSGDSANPLILQIINYGAKIDNKDSPQLPAPDISVVIPDEPSEV